MERMIIKLASAALGAAMRAVTPHLQKKLNDFCIDLYLDARRTENPWDDIATAMLLDLLNIPTPKMIPEKTGK